MKVSKKKRNIIILLLVIILMILSFVVLLHKSKIDKDAAIIKNKSAKDTGQLNKNPVKKSNGKSSISVEVPGKNEASVDDANTTSNEKALTVQQKKDEAAKAQKAKESVPKESEVISSKDVVTVYVKAANFGSIAEIIIAKSEVSNSYKYYQYFKGNTAISKVESIIKNKTTIFPVQKAGTEVVVKLLGSNKKVIKELNIKLSAR
ncbi:hypothetical protein KPL37_00800 [Clostridium frigoris]|uniref:LytR/CpsA/Psr regulator C-terminal domain-containing protein n=1 Tax=Clostridium frigoris TaxID=205327 RepID=A0ABS6BN05_9CLOT|nr:hypothetical protein [Clostridium frigoris]MBU3158311.1 hypothetical protein [Clostridium frigoris]